MSYSTAEIWLIIAVLALGTFMIRFSFLGLIGDRPMPGFVLKLLRYTAVTVIPALVAPLVLWPAANGGEVEPARLLAALATVLAGLWSRSLWISILAGAGVLFLGFWLTGQL